MNVDALEIRRKSTLVQTWANLREAWKNRKAPYAYFNFDPELVETQPKETP
jgi:hypothetical protein